MSHSRYSLPLLEPQYRHYKSRWDALVSQGWKFRTPPEQEAHTGMTIHRGAQSLTFYVRATTPEKVHKELLERCEKFANNGLG